MSKTKGKKRKTFRYIIGGDILVEDFVVRQSKLLILIAILVVLFISNRYSCMKKLIEIEDLKGQLKDMKYENLVILTELTSRSRLSQVEKLLESQGIELFNAKIPAFELRK